MEDIYIIGSGGFAKEVYFLLKEINKFKIKAFVDVQDGDDIIFSEKSIPIITEDDFLKLKFSNKPNLVMGLGDPILLDKIAKKFKDYTFPNIIHPNVVLDIDNIIMGRGNVITAGVVMTTHIKIGSFNVFNLNTTIGHDVVIGNYNIFNPSVNISGEVMIGDKNLFGVGSVVLQQKNFGNNSILGASSLLTKDAGDNLILVGVPAKQLNK